MRHVACPCCFLGRLNSAALLMMLVKSPELALDHALFLQVQLLPQSGFWIAFYWGGGFVMIAPQRDAGCLTLSAVQVSIRLAKQGRFCSGLRY